MYTEISPLSLPDFLQLFNYGLVLVNHTHPLSPRFGRYRLLPSCCVDSIIPRSAPVALNVFLRSFIIMGDAAGVKELQDIRASLVAYAQRHRVTLQHIIGQGVVFTLDELRCANFPQATTRPSPPAAPSSSPSQHTTSHHTSHGGSGPSSSGSVVRASEPTETVLNVAQFVDDTQGTPEEGESRRSSSIARHTPTNDYDSPEFQNRLQSMYQSFEQRKVISDSCATIPPFLATTAFGVEMETMLLKHPHELFYDNRVKALRDVVPALKENLPQFEGKIDFFEYEAAKNDAVYDNWKVTTDLSIKSDDGRPIFGLEFITPKLVGATSLTLLKAFAKEIRNNGFGCNTTTALHVHVSCESLTNEQIRRFSQYVVAFEPVMDSFVAVPRRADYSRYCRSSLKSVSMLRSIPDAVNKVARVNVSHCIDRLCSLMNPMLSTAKNSQRNHKINYTLLRGTTLGQAGRRLEFRQHQGTVDEGEITHWVVLVMTFLHRAAHAFAAPDPARVRHEDFWALVQDPRLEEYFTMKRVALDIQVEFTYDGRELYLPTEEDGVLLPQDGDDDDDDGEGGAADNGPLAPTRPPCVLSVFPPLTAQAITVGMPPVATAPSEASSDDRELIESLNQRRAGVVVQQSSPTRENMVGGRVATVGAAENVGPRHTPTATVLTPQPPASAPPPSGVAKRPLPEPRTEAVEPITARVGNVARHGPTTGPTTSSGATRVTATNLAEDEDLLLSALLGTVPETRTARGAGTHHPAAAEALPQSANGAAGLTARQAVNATAVLADQATVVPIPRAARIEVELCDRNVDVTKFVTRVAEQATKLLALALSPRTSPDDAEDELRWTVGPLALSSSSGAHQVLKPHHGVRYTTPMGRATQPLCAQVCEVARLLANGGILPAGSHLAGRTSAATISATRADMPVFPCVSQKQGSVFAAVSLTTLPNENVPRLLAVLLMCHDVLGQWFNFSGLVSPWMLFGDMAYKRAAQRVPTQQLPAYAGRRDALLLMESTESRPAQIETLVELLNPAAVRDARDRPFTLRFHLANSQPGDTWRRVVLRANWAYEPGATLPGNHYAPLSGESAGLHLEARLRATVALVEWCATMTHDTFIALIEDAAPSCTLSHEVVMRRLARFGVINESFADVAEYS